MAFQWNKEHTEALDNLIKMVTTVPVLGCLDPKKQFFLEVNASAFALGAILFQYNDQKKRREVAYFSKALTLPE